MQHKLGRKQLQMFPGCRNITCEIVDFAGWCIIGLVAQNDWRDGGAENAGVENAGVDSRGGKCKSGKYRSDNIWKAVKQKIKILNIFN